MGPPTRGTVEVAHPCRRRRASPRAGPRRVLLGHCGYGPGGGAARRSAPSPIRSLPRMAPPTRGSGGIAPALQPPPQLRGRPEVRRHGALRAGPGGGGPPPAPAEYDLCPRWPDRPGALRVSSPRRSRLPIPAGPAQHASFRVRRAWPERGTGPHRRCLLNTMSAPDGPTALGQCGYRPCVAAISPAQEPVDPRGAESPASGRGTRPIPLSPFASTWSERVTPRQYHSCPTSLRTQPTWRVPAAETS